ncbi:hypothetical protein GCM10025879_14140 [Leuconostoc litchii]|uniref:hypothetical protein n=1 Tax=Leuconostoc litchii TaxID=1981069 RepID=UPI00142EB7F3|nr:hypothetical protein [Leuconostoc litchii]GMA70168.1 hypothetical protein GCM10025879_14140 [Leuconostoc litchii]
MSQDTKLILFFIWVVIAMLISTVGLVMIIRWYHREVNKVKKQQADEHQKLNN